MSRLEIKQEINDLLENTDIRDSNSLFQLKFFVIEKEPTHQAKLRKCLLELGSRQEALESYTLSTEDTKDDILLIGLNIRKLREEKQAENPIDIEAAKIHIRKLNRKKQALEKAVKNLEKKSRDCLEEAQLFLESFKILAKVEALKPFNDAQANAEIWNEELTQELNLRLMLQRPLDLDLVKTALALPEGVPIRDELTKSLDQVKQKALANQTQVRLESKIDEAKEKNGG